MYEKEWTEEGEEDIYMYTQCVKETRIENDEKGTNTRLVDIGGYLPRTIIDKIESRTAEHHDSAACPRPRGGSLCPKLTTTGLSGPFPRLTRHGSPTRSPRDEWRTSGGIIFGVHEPYLNRRIF